MPQVNRIDLLPLMLRDELDRRIIAAVGGGYEGHSLWLKSRGYRISKSAIHRYGKGLKTKITKARDRAQERAVSDMLGIDIRDAQQAGTSQTLIVIRDRATGGSIELSCNIPAVELEKKLQELLTMEEKS